MKRNLKRRDPGTAVLKFFIYLLILMLLSGLGLFLLRTGRNSGERPYIATGTGAPATPTPAPTPTPEPSPEPSAQASAAPTETPVPAATSTPLPTPTPEPTAEPTPIPEAVLPTELKEFRLPDESDDGNIGISSCYVSAVDSYSIMELTGWGYAELEYFDGEECGTYVIVNQGAEPIHAYLASSVPGISGRNHTGTLCENASACDWRVYIDVSDYEPGIYSLGLSLVYKNNGDNEYRYYRFGDLQSFTVNDGEIIIPVTVTGAE